MNKALQVFFWAMAIGSVAFLVAGVAQGQIPLTVTGFLVGAPCVAIALSLREPK